MTSTFECSKKWGDYRDIFDIHIKFPSDYHAENLRGKEAIFNTEILKIESQKCSA